MNQKSVTSKHFSTAHGYRALLRESWTANATDLHIMKYEGGKRYYAKTVEIQWEEATGPAIGSIPPPFMSFLKEDEERGTALYTALEDVFTPEVKKERPFVEGELEATKKHLDDMRKSHWELLGIISKNLL